MYIKFCNILDCCYSNFQSSKKRNRQTLGVFRSLHNSDPLIYRKYTNTQYLYVKNKIIDL